HRRGAGGPRAKPGGRTPRLLLRHRRGRGVGRLCQSDLARNDRARLEGRPRAAKSAAERAVTLEDARRERDAFVERVRDWVSSPGSLHGFFHRSSPVGIARAPGRLDVMGGIADYSGSLVLELPIREAALVAAQLHPEPVVRAVSLDADRGSVLRDVTLPSAMLFSGDYVAARSAFAAQQT